MSPAPTMTETTIRDLNAERPAWATHGVVVLFDTSGGSSARAECEEASVTWCASADELERTWALARAMGDAMSDEPAIKRLDDLTGTAYRLVVQTAAEGGEQAAISFEPREGTDAHG